MTNALAIFDENADISQPLVSAEELKEFTKSTYMPYIQLMGSGSNAVKERKISVGNFALCRGKDDFDDLGEEALVVVCNYRARAMEFGDSGVQSYYDPENTEFQRIKEVALGSGGDCSYGLEYLLWLPEQGVFATYFGGNATARKRVEDFIGVMKKPATMKSVYIDPPRSKFSWYGPTIEGVEIDVVPPESSEFKTVMDKFKNPPKNEVEAADEDSRD